MTGRLNLHLAALLIEGAASFATTLPLVRAGERVAGIIDLGGWALGLLGLPWVIVLIALLGLAGRLRHGGWYYLFLSGAGFFLTFRSVRHCRIWLETLGIDSNLQCYFASGALILWVGYLALLMLPFIKMVQDAPFELDRMPHRSDRDHLIHF